MHSVSTLIRQPQEIHSALAFITLITVQRFIMHTNLRIWSPDVIGETSSSYNLHHVEIEKESYSKETTHTGYLWNNQYLPSES